LSRIKAHRALAPSRDMNEALERLQTSLSEAPVIWKGEYPYFVHPITDGVPRLAPDVLEAVVELASAAIDWDQTDVLLGIEAMGLPLTAPLSLRHGVPMVVARKRSYGMDGEVTVDQTTGYASGAMHLNDLRPGERVAIVDDVISTGGTLAAVLDGVERTGASVTNVVTVVEKGDGMAMLRERFPQTVFASLVTLRMDGANIIVT